MKYTSTLIFLIFLFPFVSEAQKISILSSSGKPVAQAVIVLKPLVSQKKEVFLTNNKGVVEILQWTGKAQVVVSHVSFELFVDTLFATTQLTINLVEKDVNLQEVVVTSEYTPRTAGESVHPVMVINREQIDNQAAANLQEVLAQQLNMRTSQDQILGSGLTLNGLSGQNIKFLVDGVPVIGRLDGNIDISQLNLNNVERIEVVNGPMAASYGTDASGGVINLITRQQVDKLLHIGANVMYESIGHYNLDFLTGYNTGKSSVVLSGGRNFFNGWSQTDTGRWQAWKPKEQYFGNVKYRWVGKKLVLGYNLNMFHENISNKGTPRVSPYFAYAFDEYYKTIRLTNQLNASYILSRDYYLSGTIAYTNYQRFKNTYRKDLVSLDEVLVNGTEQQDTTILNSWMIRGTVSRAQSNSPLNYQIGLDINIDQADGTRFIDEIKMVGDYAMFASAEYKINDKLEVKPAIRISHNTDYKSPVVPSVMFKYDLAKTIQTRLSYGKGFRAPGIKERYLYFVDINHNIRGNENLLPEYSDNFFLSIIKNIKTGKMVNSVELSGFYNDIRNMITLAQPDVTSSLYTYINLGKFSTHGGSLANTFTYNNVSLGVGVSYTGRYNIYADSGDFKKYLYSPDLNAKVQYEFKKINLNASAFFKYNGKLPGYKLESDNSISQFSNDSYKFLDASLRKGLFAKKLYVAGGIKNILNVTNINAVTQGTAHSAGSNEMAVGTGRSYFVKLQYLLGK